MKVLLYILTLSLTMSIFSSCSVHEFPDDNPVDPTLVNVTIQLSFNINTLSHENVYRASTKAVSEDQLIRFVIELYKFDNFEKPVERRVVLVDKRNPLEAAFNATFRLNATKYRALVWSDYVEKDKQIDQFYNSTFIRSIYFVEPFISATDNRDCFSGAADLDLLPYRFQWNVNVELPVVLTRPVAKYALIANDIAKYITRVKTKGDTPAAEDINKYTAIIRFPGYMPNAFNVHTGEPSDSKTGMHYTSKLQVLNNNEALLGFDYPLVNGLRSQARVMIQLYDDQGKLINEIDDVTFKIRRDSLTIFRSDFLTRNYSPGITINPDFDGNIDIILPD